ncbi:Receptor-type tyrosine-protein phosphatase H [Galemys pyrenaicus]|uniref:protein-tyrosine-phosphatase n=1 Tax=Galemys pyrenaicus TaxID=202257 RepID=A0A8J6B7Q0_GALPY|nr:Receptor-type tyrosine-protein phosphatase H [Galemys pyrenaicus]
MVEEDDAELDGTGVGVWGWQSPRLGQGCGGVLAADSLGHGVSVQWTPHILADADDFQHCTRPLRVDASHPPTCVMRQADWPPPNCVVMEERSRLGSDRDSSWPSEAGRGPGAERPLRDGHWKGKRLCQSPAGGGLGLGLLGPPQSAAMTGTGRGRGAWGGLLLLLLEGPLRVTAQGPGGDPSWTLPSPRPPRVAEAAGAGRWAMAWAPNPRSRMHPGAHPGLGLTACSLSPGPVLLDQRCGDIEVETQTNTSISLRWTAPEDLESMPSHTYWVQWAEDGAAPRNQSTNDTRCTVGGLQPATRYQFGVWAEQGANRSQVEHKNASTAPNPVGKLTVEAQTNTSISLSWTSPDGPGQQSYTYWLRWAADGGTAETQKITATSHTVGGLEPASRYELSVWAEKNRLNSSEVTITGHTAPGQVRGLRVEAQTSMSISLSWTRPDGPGQQTYNYWVQRDRDPINCHDYTSNTSYTVRYLEPASQYELSVWAEKDGVNGDKVTVTGHTGEWPQPTLSALSLPWGAQGRRPQFGSRRGLLQPLNCPQGDPGRHWERPGSSTALAWGQGVSQQPGPPHRLLQPPAPTPLPHGRDGQSGLISRVRPLLGAPPSPPSEGAGHWERVPDGGCRAGLDSHCRVWRVEGGPAPGWSGRAQPDSEELHPPSLVAVSRASSGPAHSPRPGPAVAAAAQDQKWPLAVPAQLPSTVVSLSHLSAPGQVRALRVEAQTNTSISLSWTSPDGPGQQSYTYWLRWAADGGTAETQKITATSHTVGGLEPASRYELSVWAEKNRLNSSEVTITGHTAPNEVTVLRNETRSDHSVTLQWDAPERPPSRDYSYCVRWARDGGPRGDEDSSTTNERRLQVEGLLPGTLYTFSVSAQSQHVLGAPRSLQASTAPSQATITSCTSTPGGRGLVLNWSCPAGGYSAVWLEAGGQRSDQDQASCNAGSGTVWGLQPAWTYAARVVTVWDGELARSAPKTCRTEGAGVIVGSVFGVLLFFLLVFLLVFFLKRRSLLPWPRNSKTDVPWNQAFRWAVGSGPPRSLVESGVQSLEGPGQAGALALRAWPSLAREVPAPTAGGRVPLAVSMVWTARLGERGGKIKRAVVSFVEDIPRDSFSDHVKRNERDSNCGFAEEYQQLSLAVQNQPQLVASAPENSAKNRYRNVLPYDWSRVALKPLPGEPGSDYINASFIPVKLGWGGVLPPGGTPDHPSPVAHQGLWSAQEFIATQGPLPQTVGDFWRLVWEQQSRTLVMLANCMETGRVKCEHYWPLDTKPCTHGSLQVTLISEEVTENWAVRSLLLRHVQEEKVLPVRQFHYLTWPDHGVPHSPGPMLAFWKVLRKWLDENVGAGPPIVHCSAGVGRTGTLIALDVLLRQLEAEGLVGPFNYVKKMRENRPLMVQTEAQYIFLHQCILQFLQESAAPPTQKNTYENLLYKNIAAI